MAEQAFSGQNRIVVDWDGTCVPSEWPGHPGFFPDTVAALRAFLEAGLEVVVLSTRLAPRDIDEQTSLPRVDKERKHRYIRRTLDEAGLHDVLIWRRPWKPGALFYVDDKAVRFDGDWQAVLKEVLP